MAVKTCYMTQDGEVFEDEAKAKIHEAKINAENKLRKIVEDKVPYQDNQHWVMDFILENATEILPLAKVFAK